MSGVGAVRGAWDRPIYQEGHWYVPVEDLHEALDALDELLRGVFDDPQRIPDDQMTDNEAAARDLLWKHGRWPR